jgi:hypothetical protein
MPCALGSVHRAPDLPCSFVIGDEDIHWHQWDNPSQYTVRKYVVLEQNQGEETLEVKGGSSLSWYARESSPGASHKLILSAHQSNAGAPSELELKVESWSSQEQRWHVSASWLITRHDGACP